jgi:predicted DCC family thiol-disulfide oxidoreductase YuxK
MTSPSTHAVLAGTQDVSGPVLLFDGECGLCNRLVRLLLRLDRGGRLRFAPLQGGSAQSYLRVHGLPTVDFDTLVFVPDWSRRDHAEFLVRTDGVIAALRAIGGTTARMIAAFLALFPAGMRDAGYRLVGASRYRLFGPWHYRPLARAEWAARFLP